MKIITSSRRLALLFVLSFGLISCDRDPSEPAATPLQLLAPSLVREGLTPLSWGETEKLNRPEVTAQAFWKFSPSVKDTTFTVKTFCTGGGEQWMQKTVLTQVDQLWFRDLIPIEVLIRPHTAAIPCWSDVIAINPQGSRHVFRLPEVQFRPQPSSGGVRLKENGQSIDVQDQSFAVAGEKWSQIWIEIDKGFQQVQLECENFYLTLEVSEFFPLAKIDTRQMRLRDGQGPVTDRPRQFCRVFAKNPQGQRHHSPLLDLTFTGPRLLIRFLPSSNLKPKYTLGEAQIHNPETFTAHLIFPLRQTIRILAASELDRDETQVPVTLDVRGPSRQVEGGILLSVPPGQTLTMGIRLAAEFGCAFDNRTSPMPMLMLAFQSEGSPRLGVSQEDGKRISNLGALIPAGTLYTYQVQNDQITGPGSTEYLMTRPPRPGTCRTLPY